MSVDIATLGRCVVWFSAGAASTVAAKLALVDRPDALICYIDTGSEHEDTPRYLADVSAWLGRPIARPVVGPVRRARLHRRPHRRPTTGGDTSGTLAIGAALVAAGSAAALIARRRAS